MDGVAIEHRLMFEGRGDRSARRQPRDKLEIAWRDIVAVESQGC